MTPNSNDNNKPTRPTIRDLGQLLDFRNLLVTLFLAECLQSLLEEVAVCGEP